MLAAVIEFLGQITIEEDDSIADGGAIFSAAEAEDVDAGFPGDFFGGDIERGDGISEAGAVHVEFKAERFGDAADFGDFAG